MVALGGWAQTSADYGTLVSHHLVMPVAGVRGSQIRDSFHEARAGGQLHQATDIMAPRGTAVLAVDDGNIRKLFTSARGGLTVYQFDPTETYCYYYAHLDHYAQGIRESLPVHRGEIIGYVGATGDALTPHLHFEIARIGPDKKWWGGVPINPYPILAGIDR